MNDGNLKQVSVAAIDEGRFFASINEAFSNMQREVVKFSTKHGEKAKGAKAKLVIEIVIGCISPEEGGFGLITQIKQSLPSPPARATLAMAGKDRSTGEFGLFARKCGTGTDLPTQKVLCTEDGRSVDVDSGEILDEEPLEIS